MKVMNNIGGIQFSVYINNRICIIRKEDSTAKSFVLKSLAEAEFNGYKCLYYDWSNYKSIDWFGGSLYDRYSVIIFDDADLYASQLVQYLELSKCHSIVVVNSSNASSLMRKYRMAEYYDVRCNNANFIVKQVPHKCAYCGKVFAASQLTADHIIPQNFCNTFMPGAPIKEHYLNKVRVCFDCNRSKSDDIWIPNFTKKGWMKYMTPEQIGGYSDIFVNLLNAQYDNVVKWIFVKNMQSHVSYRLDYEVSKKMIEEELEFFLRRYLDRKPGEYWALI